MQDKQEPAVVIQDLRKSFGPQTVLNGIDLRIDAGETVAVLGRSGTGKSVLLKLIVGLQKPDTGSIQIHGQEITNMPLEELNKIRQKIGFLFQEGALYDSLTLEENVAFPMRRQNTIPEKEQKERARKLLSGVGMEKDSAKMPAQISGGMKKRVALARALALDPDILLFDEPTSGLDPITASEIEDLILQLQKERQTASVVVTHDLHGAKTLSARLALMHQGNILVEGSFDDLRKSDDAFVARFLRESKE
jgi:phospholipid/cholesterol/gamma-HCH transport system ATP-binding protein